ARGRLGAGARRGRRRRGRRGGERRGPGRAVGGPGRAAGAAAARRPGADLPGARQPPRQRRAAHPAGHARLRARLDRRPAQRGGHRRRRLRRRHPRRGPGACVRAVPARQQPLGDRPREHRRDRPRARHLPLGGGDPRRHDPGRRLGRRRGDDDPDAAAGPRAARATLRRGGAESRLTRPWPPLGTAVPGPSIAARIRPDQAPQLRRPGPDHLRLKGTFSSTHTSRKRAIPEVSTQEHPDPVAADFGTNEWLIEELFEQYQKDPDLVDPAWWDFFKDYQPGNGAADGAAPPPNAPLPTRPAAQQPSASGQPASAGTSERPDAPPADPTPAPEARSTTDEREARPSARPGSDTAEGSPAPAPQARPAPSAQRVAEAVAEEPAPEAAAQPAVAGYTSTPASPQPASAPADGTVKLRGPAARVVKNMDASLEVPTATSVRAVPAKLLADNRIVINNHLARGRGGKVSFTHLIGYAVVEALGKLPEMNAAYAELDGKPAVTQPGHV